MGFGEGVSFAFFPFRSSIFGQFALATSEGFWFVARDKTTPVKTSFPRLLRGDIKALKTMSYQSAYPAAGANRYSAKKTVKPVNFLCFAPDAASVHLVGDFNDWDPAANPMTQHYDGSWQVQVNLSHGHHHYQFLVDGKATLDPKAQGIARNLKGEKVSLLSVS